LLKVMLIYPLPRLERKPGPKWLPLGLSYLASALQKEGHEVIIFDRYASAGLFGPDKKTINSFMLDKVNQFKPDLIGFNTVTPLIFDTVDCAALIRNEFKGPIIAGGHHATALPELTLTKIPELDGVIQGEGENAIRRLASGENPLTIGGVWWREGNKISGSPPVQIDDLDNLPFPDMSLLDMDFYTRPSRTAIRAHYLSVASIITSRGCTQNCDFCAESLTYGRGVRTHSADYVLEWINKILYDYPIEALYFLDNDFLVDRERALIISEKLIQSGLNQKIKFAIQTRVNRIDPEILAILKRAGCTLLELGIEAFSQDHLDFVHKGTSVDLNVKALEMCRKAGIPAHAYMIMGFKGETMADLEQRLHWLKKASNHFTISLSMLSMYPGTRLYQKNGNSFFESNPWTEEEISNYFLKDHFSTISAADRARWLKNEYAAEWRRRNRRAILRYNPPYKLLRFALDKLKSSSKQRALKIFGK